jgi:hypothetical protein
VIAGVGLLAAPSAQAIQASGSIILSPSKQLQLANGETVTVDVSVVNTSSQTPNPPGAAAAATLTGPITVDLGCSDCGCSNQQVGALTFVPGPANGCVSKAAGVTGCASSGPASVEIDLDPAGISLPAGTTPVAIATISVKINVAQGPSFGIRAGTGVCALNACIAGDEGCVSCSAEGCTFVSPNAGKRSACDCPHLCPSKIRFLGPGKPDYFEIHSIILPGAGFDPPANPFSVSISDVAHGTLFTLTVPGGIPKVSNDAFIFSNPSASSTGGVAYVKIARRDDTPGAFRIDIQAYADGIQAGTQGVGGNTITVSWDVGGDQFASIPKDWTQTAYGWVLSEFGECRPATHG